MFADKNIVDSDPLIDGVVIRREGEGRGDVVWTNVHHLVVSHSSTGFNFGYAGSGAADLALNICEMYLRSIGYKGSKRPRYMGECFDLSWTVHQKFKEEFIARDVPSIEIPIAKIREWFGNLPESIVKNPPKEQFR